jgi:NAD dependent epimerase/dehydratase family enzyme
MKKPFFFPAVPAFMMRLVMGEAADMVLGGSRISSQKIRDAGYRFQYERAEKAITASLSAAADHEGG